MFKEHGVCPMLSLTLFKIVTAYLVSNFVAWQFDSLTPKPLLDARVLEMALTQA